METETVNWLAPQVISLEKMVCPGQIWETKLNFYILLFVVELLIFVFNSGIFFFGEYC